MDLGLPSGIKWRSSNLGTSSPENAGLYVSWGNIEGHPQGSGYDFSSDVYQNTPGASIESNLSSAEDIATALLGEPCRIPAAEDFVELIENCSSIWTTLNGRHGRLFTSNLNGKVLFLPASGVYNQTSLNRLDAAGMYWTSNYYNATSAISGYLDNTGVSTNRHDERRLGLVIRPVQGGNPNRSIVPPTPEDEPKEEETPTEEEPKDKDER